MSARELTKVREHMKLSRSLFAGYLRTNVRTLGTGAGQAKCSTAPLIRLVQLYPDTILRLA
jgi:putative transcriptional regulator